MPRRDKTTANQRTAAALRTTRSDRFETPLALRDDPVLSLLEAKPVTGGVAHGGVADAPGLIGGFLQYLGA